MLVIHKLILSILAEVNSLPTGRLCAENRAKTFKTARDFRLVYQFISTEIKQSVLSSIQDMITDLIIL